MPLFYACTSRLAAVVAAAVGLVLLPPKFFLPDQYEVPLLEQPEVVPGVWAYLYGALLQLPPLHLFVTLLVLKMMVLGLLGMSLYLWDWIRRNLKLNAYLAASVEWLLVRDAQPEQLEMVQDSPVQDATSEYNRLLYQLLRQDRARSTAASPPTTFLASYYIEEE